MTLDGLVVGCSSCYRLERLECVDTIERPQVDTPVQSCSAVTAVYGYNLIGSLVALRLLDIGWVPVNLRDPEVMTPLVQDYRL